MVGVAGGGVSKPFQASCCCVGSLAHHVRRRPPNQAPTGGSDLAAAGHKRRAARGGCRRPCCRRGGAAGCRGPPRHARPGGPSICYSIRAWAGAAADKLCGRPQARHLAAVGRCQLSTVMPLCRPAAPACPRPTPRPPTATNSPPADPTKAWGHRAARRGGSQPRGRRPRAAPPRRGAGRLLPGVYKGGVGGVPCRLHGLNGSLQHQPP